MINQYRHVIWDWNGTLFDDAWLCLDIMNDLLRARGLPALTSERYAEILTFPLQEYYRRLGFNFEREPYERLGTEFIRQYEQRRLECSLRDAAIDALEKVRDAQISQSLLSAYKRQSLYEIVRHFAMERFFVGLEGSRDHYASGKLEEAVRLVDRIQCAPHEIIIVGDTIHDWEVALATGIDCVLLDSGHQSRNRLRACGVPVVDSLADVSEIVTGLT